MDIIIDAVRKLERAIEGTGCEESPVILRVDPDAVPCQYERGAVMDASFGGRTAEFTTSEPARATTRVSFMFGAALETTRLRAAACAIINVVSGFLCMSRKLRACKPECHGPCRAELIGLLAGKTAYCHAKMPALLRAPGSRITEAPESADVIILNGDGMISHEGDRLLTEYGGSKRLLLVGPSTAGVAALKNGAFLPIR